MKDVWGWQRVDAVRALRLRRRLERGGDGAVAKLTSRALKRLLRPDADGSWVQRQVRDTVCFIPLRILIPRFRRWSERTFRIGLTRSLPLYIAVFTDRGDWMEEFAQAIASHSKDLRRIPGFPALVEQLVRLMAHEVVRSLYPQTIGSIAGRIARELVLVCAPRPEQRLHYWMELIEEIDAYLRRNQFDEFFGVDFLLGTSR